MIKLLLIVLVICGLSACSAGNSLAIEVLESFTVINIGIDGSIHLESINEDIYIVIYDEGDVLRNIEVDDVVMCSVEDDVPLRIIKIYRNNKLVWSDK